MDENEHYIDDLIQLARVALGRSPDDVQMLVRRYANRYRTTSPVLARELTQLLRAAPSRSSPLRQATAPPPVDIDTRRDLLRVAPSPVTPHPPVLTKATQAALNQLIGERTHSGALLMQGLEPARSALLIGPPGVGKTLSATWVAEQLALPLLVLDLSAVMNSLLGKTGTNLRLVLDYARDLDCVLLLDELDAVAKRRDDHAEVGELKRLVTVLLQEIDSWPAGPLLLGATNHPDLLDPAIWRRFDVEIHFGLPEHAERQSFLAQLIGDAVGTTTREALAMATTGWSFADIERAVLGARRRAALGDRSLDDELLELLRSLCRSMSLHERRATSRTLLDSGLSQRRVSELTGMSRDTLRKLTKLQTEP